MPIKERKAKYNLNQKGEFVIEDYNFSRPFANFFPGIAGKYGIPMWAFYVNRGQGIMGFGIKNKDHAISEFFPANKAWQMAPSLGFRTFIKLTGAKTQALYEPFHNGFQSLQYDLRNSMSISSYQLCLEEINKSIGIKVKVEYFTIPNDNYAGLVRIVTIENLSSVKKKLQLLDGLPQIIPYGMNNWLLKELSRTLEAWVNVDNMEKGVPFYRLQVDPADRPEVTHIKEGNFYLSALLSKEKIKLLPLIIDPEDIFGPVTDYSYPRQFMTERNFKSAENQVIKSKTPCAFSLLSLDLLPKQEKSFFSLVGYMRSLQALNSNTSKILKPGYIQNKKEENRKLIEDLQFDIYTQSSSREFDLYVKQTYLDNIIRGGYPATFENHSPASSWVNPESAKSVFYIYSRKHGDLERDYNRFQLQPTYFSQGNGNYRDINQNRRCDIWFNPDINEENVISFFNLIQADGFNPLVVKGASFTLKDAKYFRSLLQDIAEEKDAAKIMLFLEKPFTPGDLIFLIEEENIRLQVSHDEFLNLVISHCAKNQEAEHGEGFWTDHWTYNLDLLESYLGLYPERLKDIVFEKRCFTFFDNSEVVKPRSEKYLLHNGLAKQLHSVTADPTKREMIKKRTHDANLARVQFGVGEIYSTTLINKLICLLVNKLASLDPFGVGIEMEADKPNWFDALNGLPALFGSSLCETFELKRLIIFIKDALKKSGLEHIIVNEEILDFLLSVDKLTEENLRTGSSQCEYEYWDKTHTLKEEYRRKIHLGFSGQELQVGTEKLFNILENALQKVDAGIKKAKDPKKEVYYSYFINKVDEYESLKPPFVKPTRFSQIRIPLFLEGQMHALRLTRSLTTAKAIYSATRKSELFDKQLKMYKVTASLKNMPEEIGRCRVFPPGWLENESIWLHMEYKFMLEILKQGLYEEFYADFKNVLIPFQPPERYGRNILENSSFIVSSAFADKKLHGNGFVARLSGSTAEFLQIWLLMNAGPNPFFLDKENKLNLAFSPILPGWLFDRKGEYSFNFLSSVLVTYHNSKRKNTFGKNAVKPIKIILTDKKDKITELSSDMISSTQAHQVRSRLIKKIDIYLG